MYSHLYFPWRYFNDYYFPQTGNHNLFDNVVPEFLDNAFGGAHTYGTRFYSRYTGDVTHIRWYKGNALTGGSHTVSLFSDAGVLLASKSTADEPASGWIETAFDNVVPIDANTFYRAAVFYPVGHGVYSDDFFATAYDNPPLHCPANADGCGGHYNIGAVLTFPNDIAASEGYYIDVILAISSGIVFLRTMVLMHHYMMLEDDDV